MTAKEYLWRVRDAERELKQLEQAYTQARADILHLKGIAYDADKVTGGKIGDLSDAIAALEGYAQRLSAKWDELINLRETAKKLIDTLKDVDSQWLWLQHCHSKSHLRHRIPMALT